MTKNDFKISQITAVADDSNTDDGLDSNQPLEPPIYEMPPEDAPLLKRLSNPVYLMCHPHMMRIACLLTVLESCFQPLLLLLIFSYFASEICSFYALFTAYGFISK